MKRVAIFGSGGQLGVELKAVFTARKYEVACFERAKVDITDRAQVEHALAQYDPALVLNAAAYNQVDVAEKEPLAALEVNGLAVRNLAIACRQIDAQLVHFSTDYVFDGLGRPRLHRRRRDAAAGRLRGLEARRRAVRARLSRQGAGDSHVGRLRTRRARYGAREFRRDDAAAGRERSPIKVVEDHVASPTFAPALAERTAQLVERGIDGIIHLGGGAPISWFDWAVKIFKAANVNPPVKPTNEREFRTAARRPKYSALSNAKIGVAGHRADAAARRGDSFVYGSARKEDRAGRGLMHGVRLKLCHLVVIRLKGGTGFSLWFA